MAEAYQRGHIAVPCDSAGNCAVDTMARLQHRAPGQQTWKELRKEVAEATCQHVGDKRWRAAFLALE
eukprot:1344918-Alexandrium_andersonii.AAC.1